MKMLKTIRLFYIMYSVYTVLIMLVSDYRFIDAFLGLALIWTVYFFFSVGFKSTKATEALPSESSYPDVIQHKFPFSRIAEWKSNLYIINLGICVACSILSTKFYTGKSFLQVVSRLGQSPSFYNEYQNYFKQNNIAAFSIVKIPYILMLTFLTAMLFWGVIGILLSGKKIRPIQIIYIIGIILSYLYFGVARGTNFEMYIVFVLIVFSLLNRSGPDKNIRLRENISPKTFIVVFVLGVIMIMVYRLVVELRGITFKNRICSEIHYDPDKLFSRFFPVLTNIILSVFSYLGFGIFVIGRTFANSMDSLTEALANILPTGYRLFKGSTLPVLVKDRIDIGVRWIPDFINIMDILGIPLLFVLAYFVGRYMSHCIYHEKVALLSNLVCFIIFMEMLSIPIGNFIVTSTPNELVVFAIILWKIVNRIQTNHLNGENKNHEKALN